MKNSLRTVPFRPFLAACFALSVWSVSAVADEEASRLVEGERQAAAEAPELSPPANGPSLPPPDMRQIEQEPAEPEALPQPDVSSSRKQPFMRPAEPRRHESGRADLTNHEEVIPMPAPEYETFSYASDVRPAPRIKYDTDGDARRMYRRSGEVNVVMIAKNPADGCLYEIPMCIPACCVGEPMVSGGHGIFGR